MNKSTQPGFFDMAERTGQLTEMGDPLVGLNTQIDWKTFRTDLSRIHDKERKSNAGAKPIDVVLMFKVLVLQQLHNLSDDRIEYQIRDRLSFMRFLGLQLEDRAPDAKTVWLFSEKLKEFELVEVLFARFHEQPTSSMGRPVRQAPPKGCGCTLDEKEQRKLLRLQEPHQRGSCH